ncbi:hypothetical protein D3C86_2131820 [compost metagenome]
MKMPSTKVIEHPDIFMRETSYGPQDFDYIIELRNTPEEEITYETFTVNYNDF